MLISSRQPKLGKYSRTGPQSSQTKLCGKEKKITQMKVRIRKDNIYCKQSVSYDLLEFYLAFFFIQQWLEVIKQGTSVFHKISSIVMSLEALRPPAYSIDESSFADINGVDDGQPPTKLLGER